LQLLRPHHCAASGANSCRYDAATTADRCRRHGRRNWDQSVMNLSIRGLNVEIQASHILRNVDIEVNDGELVCLVGRNGAGKTTTLRTVMGYMAPTRGTVELDGRSIVGWRTDKIAQHGVGFSPEESEVFASLTVDQNIKIPTWVRHSSKSAQERIDLAYDV